MTVLALILFFMFLPNTFMALQSIVVNHLLMNLASFLKLSLVYSLLIEIDQIFTAGFFLIASTKHVWILKPLDMWLGNNIYNAFSQWFYQTKSQKNEK